jgi:hypothetical protein
MAEDRVALNRRTAEALMHGTILPALATVRDELHRPEQRAEEGHALGTGLDCPSPANTVSAGA